MVFKILYSNILGETHTSRLEHQIREIGGVAMVAACSFDSFESIRFMLVFANLASNAYKGFRY